MMRRTPMTNLKGHALTLLIEQDSIAPRDLVSLLTPRKEDNLFGTYWAFLAYILPKKLRKEDLATFLDASIESQWGRDEASSTRELLRAILDLSIPELEKDAEIRSRFVALVAALGRNHAVLPMGEESKYRRNIGRLPDGGSQEASPDSDR